MKGIEMERPDQPRFDHCSRHFEQIDDRLEAFSHQHDWKLIINPLRKPERDLHKLGPVKFMFGIYVEGDWQKLDLTSPFLHTAGITAIHDPMPNARLARRENFAEHVTFDHITANLEDFLRRAKEVAGEWTLPDVIPTDDGDASDGWRVVTRKSLANFAW